MSESVFQGANPGPDARHRIRYWRLPVGGWPGVLAVLLLWPSLASAQPIPPADLPKYDLTLDLDSASHQVEIRERVTWTNTTSTPAADLVFSFYPLYSIPDKDALLLKKTIEIFRLPPSSSMDRGMRPAEVKAARIVSGSPGPLPVAGIPDNQTAFRLVLPEPVMPGKAVTVELDCSIRLPNKQGRWGYWDGVTILTNALPMLAFRDASGWRPTPFVPWAQPWFNEAGNFTATITLPANEVVACSAPIAEERDLGNGRKRVRTDPFVGRDFAVLTSARYREFRSETTLPDGRKVTLKCLAFPEHEFYANEILKIVGLAIPTFSQWFGPFPYRQFTVAESCFGWNGNECGGLVMIDQRVFAMPHAGTGYVEYLVSHETCHQWWYNLVGTNGYAEPFMDEGAATYFTHRMLDRRNGKNNTLFKWPEGFDWLPNVGRENYRLGSMYTAVRNHQMQPAAQDLPKFGHVFGLFTGAYDRGSKVFGLIEDRLGEAAFMDFTAGIVAKYGWRVLQVADYKRELETYTGRNWDEFFDRWVYGKGLTDWELVKVRVADEVPAGPRVDRRPGKRVSVTVRQKAEYDEPTIVGFQLPGQEGYSVRIPVGPGPGVVEMADFQARIVPAGEHVWTVEVTLPTEPTQVTVDPDRILLDANPGNNNWKPEIRTRLAPVYTSLEETNLTNDYDKWNLIYGPWVWGASYPDPWYTRSTMVGLRAGAYRTEEANGGVYAAYRSDYRDFVVGADATWMVPNGLIGANYEVRVAGPFSGNGGYNNPQRGVLYYRDVLKQGSSLYLPPTMYDDWFVTYQDDFLPTTKTPTPGAARPEHSVLAGTHFRLNMYTPYWDPEGGFWVDLLAAGGTTQVPDQAGTGQFRFELAGVHALPEGLGPLSSVRAAARVVGMGAFPDRGEFFALGGGTLFRGYDLTQRQGSALWVANFELRIPLVRDVEWDVLDHTIGGRNLWLATFYDVGAVYQGTTTVGNTIAQAVGAGLRLDVAVFSFIERATLRVDVAKTVNDNTPVQFWFGVQQAF